MIQQLLIRWTAWLGCMLIASTVWAAEPTATERLIDATVQETWNAWTTQQGLVSWRAKQATIDLKLGGAITLQNDQGFSLELPPATRYRVLAFEPLRMLALGHESTEATPDSRSQPPLWTVVYFRASGTERTQIRMVTLGFGDDEQALALRDRVTKENEDALQSLANRFPYTPPAARKKR